MADTEALDVVNEPLRDEVDNQPLPDEIDTTVDVGESEEQDEQATDETVDEAEQTEEPKAEEKPKRARRRVAEVEAELQAAREREAAWQQRFESFIKGESDIQTEAPDPAKYQYGEFDPGYAADLALHKAEQRRSERAKQMQEQANQAQAAAYQRDLELKWQVQRGEGYKKYGDAFAQAEQIHGPRPIIDAIALSPAAHDVAMHLANNPAELNRIKSLPIIQGIQEIALLGVKLSTPPVQRKVTNAPSPVTPVGNREVVSKHPNDQSYDEYRKMRLKQMSKKAS